MITLTPRLMAAASFGAGAEKIIDVGCDHGYLSSYMVTEGGALFAYACDINEGPLTKAKETVLNLGIEDKVDTVLCNGLNGFEGKDADTVFICGMGGELIADILSNAPWTADGQHRLILQPMTKSAKLREFLYKSGYHIEKEQILKEEHRFYCVMCVKGGAGDCGREKLFLFSNAMIKDGVFDEYVNMKIAKLKRVIEGKAIAGIPAYEEKSLIKVLEDSHAC